LFAAILQKVVDNVDGGLGAVIMGLDGIAVETYTRQADRVDINTVGMEFSFILTQAKKAADSAKLGAFEEMTIKADRMIFAGRLVTPGYFLGVALAADGNLGKARYLMRLAAPKLLAEL
jgi:predicted regulator of Ras-like GTPase activity (Roadblock/LC7/MglB family)